MSGPLVTWSFASCIVFCIGVQTVTAQQRAEQRRVPLPPNPQKLVEEIKEEAEEELPSITYGDTLTGSEWVETKGGGARVAIAEGIEYDKVKYYLSLTWTLVAIDHEKETIWSQRTSAFWNHMEVAEIELDDKSKMKVLALRNKRRDDMKDFVEYYDLKTGDKIATAKQTVKPEGDFLKIEKSWHGGNALNDERFFQVITTEEEWAEVRLELFGDREAPPADAFDSSKQLIVVLALGKVSNCNGISIAGAFESDEQITVQLQYHFYQTIGETAPEHPYGVFVLPNRKGKTYVLQRNHQGYIGGPPIWKTLEEFER